MTELFNLLMDRLYGSNVWEGFIPQQTDPEVQGWNGTHRSLSRLASSPGLKIVVDVGVWKGQSTITLANAIKESGIDGVVIAVDTFLGSPEHWSMGLFRINHGFPDLYKIFMSNVTTAGLTGYVIPSHILRYLLVPVTVFSGFYSAL